MPPLASSGSFWSFSQERNGAAEAARIRKPVRVCSTKSSVVFTWPHGIIGSGLIPACHPSRIFLGLMASPCEGVLRISTGRLRKDIATVGRLSFGLLTPCLRRGVVEPGREARREAKMGHTRLWLLFVGACVAAP